MNDLTTPLPVLRMPRLPALKAPSFGFHHVHDSERAAVEAYISERFLHVHKASLRHFMPNLVSLQCGGNYSAAAGICPAMGHSLFAEVYLKEPAEIAIAEALKFPVERQHIVEIGNLVSSWRGSSMLLFVVLGELIERLGYRWLMFTATREVEHLLARMHYLPVVLADADPSLLPDAGASWGSYYRNQPRVMVGDIRPAVAAARRNCVYRGVADLLGVQLDALCAAYARSNPAVAPAVTAKDRSSHE